MDVKNVLMALKIAQDLSTTAADIVNVIHRAQAEGRDVTPEEISEAKDKAKASIDKLKASLQERKGS
jgi:ACT domain-containing protein